MYIIHMYIINKHMHTLWARRFGLLRCQKPPPHDRAPMPKTCTFDFTEQKNIQPLQRTRANTRMRVAHGTRSRSFQRIQRGEVSKVDFG